MSYDGEICMDCGFPVAHFTHSFWNAENALWNRVVGGDDAQDDPGGILCPPCFTDRCKELGISVSWHPRIYAVREGVSPL